MLRQGRFSIKLVCKNPACTAKVFDLPERLMPDDWFEDYNDALSFMRALQSGALPNPQSTTNTGETRLSRALHKVVGRSHKLDFHDDIVSCDCGCSCHLSESGFIVTHVA
jgi:hypothetical protein